jgi:invasion protein IalB
LKVVESCFRCNGGEIWPVSFSGGAAQNEGKRHMTHVFTPVFSWSLPRRLTRAAPVFALVSALVLTLPAGTMAQQKSQAPKAAPKSQAQQAEPAPAPEIPPLVYSNWTKLCSNSAEAGGKTMCRIGKDGRLDSGTPMVGAVLMEVEGDARKILQIMLPLGILLPRGTRVLVDNDEQGALVLPIVVCAGGGCMAQAEASADMVAKLKKGQNLYVQAYNMQQTVFTLAVPLDDFAKVYDGPPTDPKDMEERNKKLQEELAKRGRERLQQQK